MHIKLKTDYKCATGRGDRKGLFCFALQSKEVLVDSILNNQQQIQRERESQTVISHTTETRYQKGLSCIALQSKEILIQF